MTMYFCLAGALMIILYTACGQGYVCPGSWNFCSIIFTLWLSLCSNSTSTTDINEFWFSEMQESDHRMIFFLDWAFL
ncbi:hypothetical protein GDO78_017153 [Eleutherodactylus coqui]|uniref:Secreted protein n=1 Tax=Eleutherodactylus coqui TaxID=57060 RepID=A0A8J6E7M6_ELECQ|nr:hypothetical protein GDO78_017153 [Eleutherodactylus coqui]